MNAFDTARAQELQTRRFWRWQFAGEATTPQLVFDIVFGVVGPVLCFVFDPIVFRGRFGDRPLFSEYQVFVYLVSGFEIMTLLLWLTFGQRLRWKRFIGGIFIAGGVLCTLIGCLLLPYSIIGLMFVIGLLGFTPFFTAVVYFRNGYRALRSEPGEIMSAGKTAPILVGCLLALAIPALLSMGVYQAVTRSVDDIIQGDQQRASAASARLRWLNALSGAELNRIVNVYQAEGDAVRRERLRRSYLEITGEDIETKVRQFRD